MSEPIYKHIYVTNALYVFLDLKLWNFAGTEHTEDRSISAIAAGKYNLFSFYISKVNLTFVSIIDNLWLLKEWYISLLIPPHRRLLRCRNCGDSNSSSTSSVLSIWCLQEEEKPATSSNFTGKWKQRDQSYPFPLYT